MQMPDWLVRSVCVGLVLWMSLAADAEARLEFRPCTCYEESEAWSEEMWDTCGQLGSPPPEEEWCAVISNCVVNTTTGTMSYWGYCQLVREGTCAPEFCGLE
jgi:hypothetical protein